MSSLGILIMIAGAVAIGAVLFFPMRWLLTRNNPESAMSPKVTSGDFLQAALVVGGNAWLYFSLKKQKERKD